MKKIIKDILILCVITIICGGLLGYVYQITKNPIQHQLQQSKQYAYLKVMKEATSFKTYKENDIKKLSKKLKGDYGKNGLEIENALKAYHQKQTIGYIIQVVDHDGFGGDIELIVGINLQKELLYSSSKNFVCISSASSKARIVLSCMPSLTCLFCSI